MPKRFVVKIQYFYAKRHIDLIELPKHPRTYLHPKYPKSPSFSSDEDIVFVCTTFSFGSVTKNGVTSAQHLSNLSSA